MPPSFSQATLRRALTLGGLGAAAVVSSRFLFRPSTTSTGSRLLDWEAVRRSAWARTGETGPLRKFPERNVECDTYARELAPLMAEVCQSEPAGFPQFQAVDRRGFIDQNILIVQRIMAPLEELKEKLPESRITALGRTAASRYMGELLGFMSHRVLGQYDPVLMLGAVDTLPGSSLFLVETNLLEYEKQNGVSGRSLRRWLILHELTHAWQFETHPWLRDHIMGLMNDLLLSTVVNDAAARPALPPARDLLSKLPLAVRRQLAGVGQIQAVMSLLEGYSNYVMNRVGKAHLEDFDQLESSFHKRRTQRSLLERLVLAITGMNMKLRQYQIGEKFCTAVAVEGGVTLLNRVWEGPEMVPTMAELRSPALWIARAR